MSISGLLYLKFIIFPLPPFVSCWKKILVIVLHTVDICQIGDFYFYLPFKIKWYFLLFRIWSVTLWIIEKLYFDFFLVGAPKSEYSSFLLECKMFTNYSKIKIWVGGWIHKLLAIIVLSRLHGGTCIIYILSQIYYLLTVMSHRLQIKFWASVLVLEWSFLFQNNLHSLPAASDGANEQSLSKIPQRQLKAQNLIAS